MPLLVSYFGGKYTIVMQDVNLRRSWVRSLLELSVQSLQLSYKAKMFPDFAGGAVVKNLPANAGDTGLSPGLGRSHMPRSS